MGGELLTPAEAIAMLKLDDGTRKRPLEALRHLRRTRRLQYIQIGRLIRYRRSDLERMLADHHREF